MGKKKNDTFYVNVYKYNDEGYMFGDVFIRHKSAESAAKVVRKNRGRFVGIAKLTIKAEENDSYDVNDVKTEWMGNIIPHKDDGEDKHS